MENNKKNFNRYIFFSTFARQLVEVFIGTILFKAGFNLRSVLCYFLLVNVFSTLLAYPLTVLSKRYSNKLLTVIGILNFILVQVALNYVMLNHIYLIILALLYSLYRRCYWLSRRYYTLQIIQKQNISKNYSWISIINQIAVLVSGYVGSLLLEYVNIHVITGISSLLLLIGLYCIFKLDFEYEKNDTKLNLIETFKITHVGSIIHMGCFELQNVLQFLLPLYIIIYVKNTYTAVGLINLLAQLATIIFVYAYGALIDKEKNYLKFSLIIFVISKILQVNSYGLTLFIITFITGLTSKMYEQSNSKEMLILSKNYEYHNYNLMYEFTQNIFRTAAIAICVFFVSDIRVMIYLVIGLISLPLLFKFNTDVKTQDSEVIWKEE